jgi:sugar (pentulose or hexulose) kinase
VPYLVRDVPWGGAKLIRHAAEQLAAEEAPVAQELIQGSARPEFAAAIKSGCEALVSELQLSFDYFENRLGQPPEEILVSGGLSQSGAFLEGLKGRLTQAVAPWSPVQGLSGQFAVAYGLALRVT